MTDQHELDAIEAIAVNAINRRLAAIARVNWGIVEVSAKALIESALAEVVADQVAPAYAALADVAAPAQDANTVLDSASKLFKGAANG